jgi:light-regulated signal transduction histidine kinase (bacteriophytochrome)
MPAVQGILGKSGIVEEKDYRESQVLAALKNIPGTPWLMVAKVDQDEVYAALRVRIWITGLLFIALFSITALALGLQWRRHDNRWLRRQLEAEREIHRQRKIAEEEIRKLNAELEQRVRERTADLKTSNEELESFTYSVAHDLRAPLRGIDGWSLALQEDYGHLLDENGRRYMERVRSESQRMGRLIDDLLQLSRIAQAEVILTPVNLTAMANAIALRLKEANPERQAEFLISPALTARGDAHLLEVALYNLIENAWKFTGKRSEARIEVGRIQENGQAIFFVRDNGAGFDMAYSGRLFGAFQRLHKSSEYPGTGVGLATVQRIIRRHSGRVWAEAQQDQGATFYFTFQETQ